MLEQSRRERHGKVRDAIRGAVSPQPEKGPEAVEGASTRRAFASRRSLIALVVLVVVVGGLILHFGKGSNSPALATSCTMPAVAVGAEGNSQALRYSLTGPPEGTYVIALDATTARLDADGVSLTPAGAVAVAIKKTLTGCKTDGALPSPLTGSHELVIFRDGRVVARAQVPSR